jgi:hypothetical protein
MSQASVGSGSANDDNENHPVGTVHSKTLGAEAEGQDAANSVQPPVENLRLGPDGGVQAGAGDVPGQSVQPVISGGVPVRPEELPDGPNVAPSPWEQSVAKKGGKL